MKIRPFICLLVSLHVILFLTISCGRGHKDFYETVYPQLSFTLWTPNGVNLQEMYVGKNNEGHVYHRIDSSGIIHTVTDPATSGKDSGIVNEKRVISDPEYLVTILGRSGWNLSFTAVLSGKYQDTAVVYDKNKMKEKDFLELYVFGPGRDSAFYADLSGTEVIKDGKKLYKLVNADGTNITYTGMVDKYWFMFQFTVSGKDTSLAREIWDRSHFNN